MKKIFFLFLVVIFSKANSNEVIKQIIFKTSELKIVGKQMLIINFFSKFKLISLC